MKLALVIALAADRRSGCLLSPELVPADQAIKTVKDLITEGKAPDARFPIVMAVSIDSRLREHRFKPTSTEVAEAAEKGKKRGKSGPSPKVKELQAQLDVITAERDEALKQLEQLTAPPVPVVVPPVAPVETTVGDSAPPPAVNLL